MEHLLKMKNPLQDLLSSLNAVISALEFITGHVIYNLAYTYKFQLKTTLLLFHTEVELFKKQTLKVALEHAYRTWILVFFASST